MIELQASSGPLACRNSASTPEPIQDGAGSRAGFLDPNLLQVVLASFFFVLTTLSTVLAVSARFSKGTASAVLAASGRYEACGDNARLLEQGNQQSESDYSTQP